MFSYLNFNSPPQVHDYFVHVSNHYNHYNTISSKNKLLRTPRVRTKYDLNSVKYAGAIQWNNISLEIRESNSINGFKTMLKKHLISGYM